MVDRETARCFAEAWKNMSLGTKKDIVTNLFQNNPVFLSKRDITRLALKDLLRFNLDDQDSIINSMSARGVNCF